MGTILEQKLEEFAIKLLLSEKVKKSTDHNTAISNLTNLLNGYDIIGEVALLPDLTPANSLPTGTTVIVDSNKAVNPSFIGMDIGCGYHFFSAEMNPKRFLKKGKFKERSAATMVEAINKGLKYRENSASKKFTSNLPIKGIEKMVQQQFGTLGKGNHFIDMFVIDKIYDQQACQRQGISDKKVYFMIHSGSRELGFATNAYFSKLFKESTNHQDFNRRYLKAVKEAVAYASANRDYLRQLIEQSLINTNGYPVDTKTIFDKPHNDIEVQSDGYKIKKGTASLIPGDVFVIPGTAVDAAYLVEGSFGLENSLGTINHGAGRKYTRAQIFSKYRRKKFDNLFNEIALNVNPKKMIEEIPKAYKNIDDVMDSVEEYDLARRIARLRPVGVIVER